MVAIKNLRRKTAFILAAAALVLQPGCTPPGPRALLDGDELLRQGKPAEAVEELKSATELLPADPRAWNLLGLAYHRSGQAALAEQAYRHALAKDQSNVVAVAHYNLGCLLLEQNKVSGAIDELRSYTLMTNSTAGLVKLATAQLRARQWDAAEKNFQAVLRVEPQNAECLNGLGVIHAYRNQRDAAQSRFNSALVANPKYPSALLNSALLAQQNPGMKPAALQRYREFLAVEPQGHRADTVKLLVRQLEAELAPATPVVQNLSKPHSPPVTNTRPAFSTATNLNSLAVAKSNPPIATLVKTNQTVVLQTNQLPITESIPVTVVAVSNNTPARIASAPALAPSKASTPGLPPPPAEETTPEVSSKPVPSGSDEDKKKPGLLARLNPFSGKAKPATNEAPRSVVLNPSAEMTPEGRATEATQLTRYRYISPPPPTKGNRANAERLLQRALDAQRAGRASEASLQFQNAIAADPGYFDAQYNAALYAFQAGDLKRALAGWETALALEPDSINARYSFALTLKQANYPRDAVLELEKIIEGKPEDARAHLALGNLYAQSLNEPAKARGHYQKFLSLDPRNSQASAIRFWLAANP